MIDCRISCDTILNIVRLTCVMHFERTGAKKRARAGAFTAALSRPYAHKRCYSSGPVLYRCSRGRVSITGRNRVLRDLFSLSLHIALGRRARAVRAIQPSNPTIRDQQLSYKPIKGEREASCKNRLFWGTIQKWTITPIHRVGPGVSSCQKYLFCILGTGTFLMVRVPWTLWSHKKPTGAGRQVTTGAESEQWRSFESRVGCSNQKIKHNKHCKMEARSIIALVCVLGLAAKSATSMAFSDAELTSLATGKLNSCEKAIWR